MLQLARYGKPLLVLVLLAACASREPGDPVEPGYNVYTPEQDIAIGKQAAAEVRKQIEVVEDERLQNYIRRVGGRLAEQPEAGEFPYEFTLINEESINAFALPGGPIFIHSGLLEAAGNEAQLAGVLAHEISHVALRHGTSQASKAQIIQLPAVLAGAALGDGGALSQLGQLGVGLGLNALIMKYSRSAEKEADALGTKIMAKAGYNPMAMAEFFQKLAEEGGPRPPVFLSSHPEPGNRVENVRAEMQALPPQDYGYRTGRFDEAKRLAARLPPPKKRPQQVAAANQPPPPPSEQFETIRGRTFAIAHPANWETFGDQRSQTLTIAPREGLVRSPNGGSSLGYGAVLAYYQPQQARNLREATVELIRELQGMNPGMRVAGEPQSGTVSGSPALFTMLSSQSPYGGAERNALLTVSRPQGVFYMVFVAPEQGWGQIESVFQRMADSIRFAG